MGSRGLHMADAYSKPGGVQSTAPRFDPDSDPGNRFEITSHLWRLAFCMLPLGSGKAFRTMLAYRRWTNSITAWLTSWARSCWVQWMRRWKSFLKDSSGDVKGTIRRVVRFHFTSNDVRRHRLISMSYISLLSCHRNRNLDLSRLQGPNRSIRDCEGLS
jgi:hypothetical protein